MAAHVVMDNKQVKTARIALNAVAPHPIRATAAEEALVGSALDEGSSAAAAQAAAEACDPFTDSIASEWYRRKMVDVFVRRTLARLA